MIHSVANTVDSKSKANKQESSEKIMFLFSHTHYKYRFA